MKRNFPRIIFFIDGPNPSNEQFEESLEYGLNVVFRNASLIAATGCREECDGVAGEVPPTYKDKPTAEEALSAFAQSFRRKADAPDDGATGDGLESAIEAGRKALEAEAGKGKGKAEPEKPVTGDPAKPEAAPAPPAVAPEWKPNA